MLKTAQMETTNNANQSGKITSGQHKSFWVASTDTQNFPTLTQNLETDVLVIGGGIAGLTTAYLLAKSGRQVVLVEDGQLGSGESGRTTAHLTAALDDRYYYIENVFGEKAAGLAAESHTAAIETIEEIVASENIDCHLRRVTGYLFSHPSDKPSHLEKEFAATQRAGLDTNLRQGIPGLNNGLRCIEFPNQGQFHIMKYLRGLARAISAAGGQIFTGTHATDIDSSGAKCNGYQVKAKHIVVATNSPVNDLVTMHTKQHPYRTYVIAGKVKKGTLPYALWWDTGDVQSKWVSEPYHYVRLEQYDEQYDLLIAGGEDHKTGQSAAEDIAEPQRYERLEAWTRAHFPDLEQIDYRWSGQVLEPVDSLGFMGKNPGDDNIYIITGDSGNGMTHTTIGALIITDLINGVKNKWADLYDPARITFRTAGDFLSEAGNMAAQYRDWVLPSDIKDADSLHPGEGGIITSGLRKLAVYRDDAGKLQAFSAVCPHLGCIVRWNKDEKSFDCPCHGSRFTCDGTVINGPALTNLDKTDL
jgi:glycine/D-amino acid oxidase-like deaminating enzyme/nitrite reductase/ring-hydroxylating ferredoxin subunit